MAEATEKPDEVKSPEGNSSSQVKSGSEEMHVKVYSPFKVYFEGAARSLSAESATGPFDILPRHHNFITLLQPCELIIRTSNNEEKFAIDGGVMHVKADDIVIFLDI